MTESQEGTQTHCWRCFKDQATTFFIDGMRVEMCRGCQFALKSMVNFLNVQGLAIRATQPRLLPVEGGEDRVVKGKGKNGHRAEENSLESAAVQDNVLN